MEQKPQIYSSADVVQQTDAMDSQPTENNELNQEPISNEEEFADNEPMIPDQERKTLLQEGYPIVTNIKQISDEIGAQLDLQESQQSTNQETILQEAKVPDTDDDAALEIPQSVTHEQDQTGLVLEDEINAVEQQNVTNKAPKEREPQTEQESSTEPLEGIAQEPQTMDKLAGQSQTIVEKEQLFEEEQNITPNYGVLAEGRNEKNLPSDLSNATATVKVMLIPDCQVVTMAFSIGYSVEDLKKYFASQMKVPETVIRIIFEGRAVEDQETLADLGVTPHGTIQLEMLSLDPENYPIKALKLQHEYIMPDVITVRVLTGEQTYQDLVIEIERLNYRKPYLGGYRNKMTGVVFHHAGTQTVPKNRPERGVVVYCRDTQTVNEKNKSQQARNNMATQMTKIGCYVANITDKLLEPKKYVTAEEFHTRRLKATIVIQTYYRRFHAKRLVQQLREEKWLRLEWEEREEIRKKKEKEAQLKRDYERRMNPKTKEDFEILYQALELWSKEEIERINQTYTGAERKAALSALLEQETQLIASIGRHKLAAGEENQQKIVQFLLKKCSEPKKWKAFDGKTTEMDTQYTIRAKELSDIYTSINTKYFRSDERLDALLTLKHTVKEHDCKLTQEIVELIDREADLLMRGVKDCNLEGLRKRISTLFLQYIKVPTFNPEIARLLKVPQDSGMLRKNIHFCSSCKNYLPSIEFSLSANARTMGRCRNCSKLDNEARQREEFSKYKILLKQLKKSETDYNDGARIAFLLQEQDLQYLVQNIWAAHSALSNCDDLYDLVIVRWDKYLEWSPWNCILLTKDEATAHLKLANAEEAHGIVFIRKIKHRHTLAKNYFSQIPNMAQFLHGEKSSCTSTKSHLDRSKTVASAFQA